MPSTVSLVIDQGKFGEKSKLMPIFHSSYSPSPIFVKVCVLASPWSILLLSRALLSSIYLLLSQLINDQRKTVQ